MTSKRPLVGGKLECEIFGKPLDVPLNRLNQSLGFDAVKRGQLLVRENFWPRRPELSGQLFRPTRAWMWFCGRLYPWPYPGFSRLAQKFGWVQLLSMNLPRPIVHLSNRSYPLLIKVAAALKLLQITFQVVRDLLEHQRRERLTSRTSVIPVQAAVISP